MVEYSASTVNVVSSNPRVGSLPRVNISFFQLSACTEELLSTPNIMIVLQSPLPFVNEKNPSTSNLTPNPEYEYLLGSAFLVNLAALNKKFRNVKSVPTLYGLKFILQI